MFLIFALFIFNKVSDKTSQYGKTYHYTTSVGHISGFKVEKNENKENSLVYIDPSIDCFSEIVDMVLKHSFDIAATKENAKFLIKSNKDIQTEGNKVTELDFLFTENHVNYVKSNETFESSRRPHDFILKHLFLRIVFVLVAFLIIYISSMHYSVKGSVSIYSGRTKKRISVSDVKEKAYVVNSINSIIDSHNKSPFTEYNVVSVKRDYPSLTFRLLTSIVLKDGNHLIVQWNESNVHNDDISLTMKFKSDDFKAVKTKIEMRRYRGYRPFRVHAKLNTNTNISLEVPLNILQPFLPSGSPETLLSNVLVKSSDIMFSNGALGIEFNSFSIEQCTNLHAIFCFVVNDYDIVIWEYHKEGIEIFTSAEKIKLIHQIPNNDNGLLAGIARDAPYVCYRRTSSGMVIFGIEESEKCLADYYIPMISVAMLFLSHLISTTDKIMKSQRLIDTIKKNDKYSYIEFYEEDRKLKVMQLIGENHIYKKFTENDKKKFNELILKGNSVHFEYTMEDGTELCVTNGLLYTGGKRKLILVLIHDAKGIYDQLDAVVSILNDLNKSLKPLNIHPLDMYPEPNIQAKDKLLEKLGHPPGTDLISVVYYEDVDKLITFGHHNNVIKSNDDYKTKILKSLMLEEIATKMTNNYREITMNKRLTDIDFIRVYSSDKHLHFFSIFGNADIAFIFPMDEMAQSLYDIYPAFPLTTAKVQTTFWGVKITTDIVYPLYELPTIWSILGVDNETPFSNAGNFMDAASKSAFESSLYCLRCGRMESWTGDVLIVMVGGKKSWFRLSMYIVQKNIICALTNIDEIKFVETQMIKSVDNITTLGRQLSFHFWSFIDEPVESSCMVQFFSPTDIVFAWNDIDNIIDEEFREQFMRSARTAIDRGHHIKDYIRTSNARSMNEISIFIGKRQAKSHIIYGSAVKCDCDEFSIDDLLIDFVNDQCSIVQSLILSLYTKRVKLNDEQRNIIKEVENEINICLSSE